MRKILLFFLLPLTLFAYEGEISTTLVERPWFTGPLISNSGNITPAGHWNIQPYLFATAISSFYDNDWKPESEETLWTLQWRVPVYVGITQWLDIRFAPIWNWHHREGPSHWSLGDFNLQIDFQLFRDSLPSNTWLPSMRIILRETIPTGKYRNLDPQKMGTDAGGNGSWTSTIGFNASKIYHCYKKHYLNVDFNIQYGVPAPVHMKGLNAYGGGLGTNGTIYPEKICQVNFGFEYTVDRNWGLALDLVGVFNSSTRFSGSPGIAYDEGSANVNPYGLPAVNKREAMIQYSLAPALEYNWSRNLGIIGGCWFTVAGKNSPKFTSGVIALNYFK